MTRCTCAGCSYPGAVLHHAWQQEIWNETGEYKPCRDRECGNHCPFDATAEDLLCDHCRNDNKGVSYLNPEAVAEWLRAWEAETDSLRLRRERERGDKVSRPGVD